MSTHSVEIIHGHQKKRRLKVITDPTQYKCSLIIENYFTIQQFALYCSFTVKHSI